jgi:hypothetical protein
LVSFVELALGDSGGVSECAWRDRGLLYTFPAVAVSFSLIWWPFCGFGLVRQGVMFGLSRGKLGARAAAAMTHRRASGVASSSKLRGRCLYSNLHERSSFL